MLARLSVYLSVCPSDCPQQNIVNATSTVSAGSFRNFAGVFVKV